MYLGCPKSTTLRGCPILYLVSSCSQCCFSCRRGWAELQHNIWSRRHMAKHGMTHRDRKPERMYTCIGVSSHQPTTLCGIPVCEVTRLLKIRFRELWADYLSCTQSAASICKASHAYTRLKHTALCLIYATQASCPLQIAHVHSTPPDFEKRCRDPFGIGLLHR